MKAFFVLALSLATPLLGQISLAEYKARRAALKESIGAGAVLVLHGKTEAESHGDRDGFFQEPNFYYLTGWTEAGAVLMLTSSGETLFLPKRDASKDKWHGKMGSAEDMDILNRTGFDRVESLEHFAGAYKKAILENPKLYAIESHAATAGLKAQSKDWADPKLLIARQRMKKSPAELRLLARAVGATLDAHRESWKRTEPGLYEYQVSNLMTHVYRDHGCERNNYPPIVGAGPNSVLLHYNTNKRRMDAGELLLLDVGAECAMYGADITRTIPVNGKFTARQKEIYELVLGAQKAAIAAAKPGIMLTGKENSLWKVAHDYFEAHGKMGKYFIHGLGHHIGLEVHDAWDPKVPLGPGMVITIEPGLYIPEENIGVRIEDMVLITETGATLLSGSLPREINQIEEAMKRKK